MSVTKTTQSYISSHPSVKDCLARGLVNYSALSREICKATGSKQFDAVLMACRRYADRVGTHSAQEKKIVSIIKQARIRMVNKIIVAVVEKVKDPERVYNLERNLKQRGADFQFVDGDDVMVIISDSGCEGAIRETFKGKVLKVTRGLARISMSLDERMETTPGVVAFIYGKLAESGINVLEETSCWTSHMMVVNETDAAKAMRVLSLEGE